MEKMKNYFKILLLPLLLVMIITSCDDRLGVVTPPVITIPTVSSTNPANTATGVAFNSKITATFSEEMDPSTITTSTFTLKQGTTPISGIVIYSGLTAIFMPSDYLTPNTTYTGTITTGAKNLAGNALASNYVWNFTTSSTLDITPPIVNSTDPANLAMGVALNKKLVATFNEVMDASTITSTTFTLKQGTTSVSGNIIYSGLTAVFIPSNNLAPNTTYTGTITTGAKDLAGNALVNNYVWNFTTGSTPDITAPIVSFTDPANAATDVALNKKIAVTFSKEMDASTITTATFTLRQGTTSVSGSVNYSGLTAIFTPSSALLPTLIYTGTITTGAKDLAGNALDNNYVWNFTTGSTSDITAPVVSSTDPANLATGVALNKKISAIFSETMDASTITTTTFTLKQGTTSVSGSVTYSGLTAIFTPSNNLLPSTIYTGTITTGAKDLAGNALASNYVWTFTTGSTPDITPPLVNFTDPANAETNVVLNKKISATFSEVMDASTITTATFTLKQGTTTVLGTVNYSGTTAIFTPSSTLAPNTIYTGTITTGAKDLAGNALTYIYVWNFTTAASSDIIPPVVNSTDPVNLATDVPLDKKISATFSETMDAQTITTATFTVMQSTIFISGTVSYSGTTAIFSPSSNLVQNTKYTCTITTGAKDLAGNALVANYVWSFTTTSPSGPSGPAGVNLGSAGNFAVLAGSGVSNTSVTTLIYGDVGSFPTATINGLLPGNVVGILYTTADPLVGTAKTDLTTAYNDAQGRSLNAISLPGQLGGLTLAPGLYVNSTSSGISGTGANGILTLDAGGNPNAVWIFKMGSTLVTDSGTSIVLAGGADWKNVYWSVGTSATLGTNSIFYGNILADQSITLTTGATLHGRALTRVAAVTLDSNIVDKR